MGDKLVTELPGINRVLGKKLKAAGPGKAYNVLDRYLALGKDEELFQEWMKDACGASITQSQDCYRCLSEYWEKFLGEGKRARSEIQESMAGSCGIWEQEEAEKQVIEKSEEEESASGQRPPKKWEEMKKAIKEELTREWMEERRKDLMNEMQERERKYRLVRGAKMGEMIENIEKLARWNEEMKIMEKEWKTEKDGFVKRIAEMEN